MNIKSTLTLAVATTVVIAIGYNASNQDIEKQANIELNQSQPVTQNHEQNTQLATAPQQNVAISNHATQVMKKPTSNKPHEIPNYDTRQIQTVEVKPQPTMSREQSTKVMAEKQAEMEKLVAMYDASLSDPKRRADIERKFKLHMADYKQALIAKSQRGEL